MIKKFTFKINRVTTGSLFSILLFLTTSTLGSHIINTVQSQSQSSPNIQSFNDAKKLLSDILEMKNSSNDSYDLDISKSGSDDVYNKFRQDIGNRYNNSEYGIIDFILPEGWFASETPNGKNSIIVDIHPGTQKRIYGEINFVCV